MMAIKRECKIAIFDLEWIELIKEAKIIGLSPEEVRAFFKEYKKTT